ncbi:AIR synthase family protein [Anaerosporobacter sp.]|uniref:AIR synthase family protein n=1 Tax=Anaerosporobacter sp. TaxID=1872529 RepID=UPI00286F73E7|nr:AIR synthase family protein [Anaerosporobacter sp.]
MKVGKIPELVLKRSVFKQIKHRRQEVLVRPGVGVDCSALAVGEDEAIVLSTDPITGTANNIADLAIHITANDIAVSGAEMIGVMLSIIMPENGRESDLRAMMQKIEACCASMNIEVMGGHTEVSTAVNQIIVTVTGVGKIKKDKLANPHMMKEGQEIVMTKWAGLEGTAIMASEKREELCTRYTSEFIDGASKLIEHISIVKEAKIASKHNAIMMHDATEGGIFGALWEIGAVGNVGMEVDLTKIPMKQETVEICEFFDVNPYLLMSSGSLLVVTERANELIAQLEKEGIPATVIGRITDNNERIVMNDYEKRYLEPPRADQLYKAFHK